MSRPTLLFRGPVETRSGYGSHARDVLECLHKMDMFEISVDSCMWGVTPMTALDESNEFHNWIKEKTVTSFNGIPDIYVSVTISNEFQRIGRFNIGVTAGIETTVAGKDLVDGCNNMDLIIVPSTFTRDVYFQTVYNENEKDTGRLLKQHKLSKPIEVLFEGADTSIYNDVTDESFNLDIQEDFAFLFVGHWLKGDIGQDRKDVGMLIKVFAETFKDVDVKPALVLKTSAGSFSVKDREAIRKKILDITKNGVNLPSIYLLYGDLSDKEMNSLYNHPKIKSMISLTKGEGFGRPLLEFSMTGKPIIASNWSGHKDFLPLDKSVLLGGTLTEVHDSAVDKFILKNSKWFTANYGEAGAVMKLMIENYDNFKEKSEELKETNKMTYSLDNMRFKFEEILKPYIQRPERVDLKLPKLNKIS
jgi:glycosyltransferase involved in cell wall biosynthesis